MKAVEILRLILWLAALPLLFALYALSNNPLLLVAAVFISIAPPLFMLLEFLIRDRCDVKIRINPTCNRGESFICEFEIKNASIIPIPRAVLEITCKNILTGESMEHSIAMLIPAYGSSSRKIKLSSKHCGELKISAASLRLVEMLGIFHVNARANAEQFIIMLPETSELLRIQSGYTPSNPDNDSYADGIRGDDYSEVLQLRDYVPGVSLKHIHWKLSGKLDRLIVREASMPGLRSLLICMDNPSDCTAAESDAIAEITASVCRILSDSGMVFSISRPQSGICGFMKVESKMQLPQAIEWLMGCTRDDYAYPNYIEQNGAVSFGKIIWCGKRFTDAAAAFCGNAEITMLLCAEANGTLAEGAHCLTPENYRDLLSHLEL